MSQPNLQTLPAAAPSLARGEREGPAGETHRRTVSTAVALGAFWAAACAHLATHWSSNPQYAFGYLVFPLALVLMHRRWITRLESGKVPRWGNAAVLGAALAFLPTWLLAQPSPDWRLLSWLLAGQVVALTIGVAGIMGGSRWAWHFAFPAAFIFTAIPWPSALEEAVIGGLMRAVSGVSVVALNLLGTPAVQQGNLIEVRSGLLGVDEACSGVRSLQGTLMAALFLGEFFRFGWGRRVGLVVLGIVAAFATNVGRAFFLAHQAATDGLNAVERWHDPAGFTVATICFVLVWLAAVVMARGNDEPLPTNSPPAGWAVPLTWSGALLAWLVLVLVGTELWFRSGPTGNRSGPQWSFAWPQHAPDFREVPIASRAAQMLRFDVGRGASWNDAAGERWLAYHFRWSASAGRARILAAMHRPENCLPSSGWSLAEDRGVVSVNAGSLTLPFRALRFERGGAAAHVWFCLWQDRAAGASQSVDEWAQSAQRASVLAVLRQERGLSQQVLEVALLSDISGAEADAAFQRELTPLIRPTGLPHSAALPASSATVPK
jgi:exosortase